jgi:hypothetical protein
MDVKMKNVNFQQITMLADSEVDMSEAFSTDSVFRYLRAEAYEIRMREKNVKKVNMLINSFDINKLYLALEL